VTGRRRLRRLALAATALAGTTALSACGDPAVAPATRDGGPPAADAAADADADASERRFLSEIDRSRGFRDCFLPIRDPEFVAVDGAHGLDDGEVVVGLDLGAARVAGAPVAFAYPIQYLNFHEIVEHRVATADGDLHLLACW